MTKLKRLEKAVSETKAAWLRACKYAGEVRDNAIRHEEFIQLHSPVRRRYERAVEALRRETASRVENGK